MNEKNYYKIEYKNGHDQHYVDMTQYCDERGINTEKISEKELEEMKRNMTVDRKLIEKL